MQVRVKSEKQKSYLFLLCENLYHKTPLRKKVPAIKAFSRKDLSLSDQLHVINTHTHTHIQQIYENFQVIHPRISTRDFSLLCDASTALSLLLCLAFSTVQRITVDLLSSSFLDSKSCVEICQMRFWLANYCLDYYVIWLHFYHLIKVFTTLWNKKSLKCLFFEIYTKEICIYLTLNQDIFYISVTSFLNLLFFSLLSCVFDYYL